MAHKFARTIPLALAGFSPNAIYLGVDEPIPMRMQGLADFIGATTVPLGAPLVFVHVMSRPAGGEVRGYVLVGGELRLRLPSRPGSWPKMDAAVSAALGAPVAPYCATENGAHRYDQKGA